MENTQLFTQAIREATGHEPLIREIRYQGGGCINNSVILATDLGNFFIKYNSAIPRDMFEKEAMGLNLLATTGTIRIPELYGYGKIGNFDYLILEQIIPGPLKMGFWQDFGHHLATLHRNYGSDRYGLDYPNYIGRLPQPNTWHEDWITFFIQCRIEIQLHAAVDKGLIRKSLAGRFGNLYSRLQDLLPIEKPSLLHGDLWGGNFVASSEGEAVLFDPAVYYGHREMELAFTKMFGGFDDEFYQAYNEAWPLERGFDSRIAIYNLYPSLVHLNLFGTSYLPGIVEVIERYA